MRFRLPRQSEVRKAPGSSRSSRLRKQRAPDARDLRVPGQRRERLGLRDADELGGLGAVADVLAVPVGEEVGGRAVDELEALLGDRLPVLGRDALAHDPARDGGELVVDVLDARGVDLLADVADLRGAPGGGDEVLEVGLLRRARPRGGLGGGAGPGASLSHGVPPGGCERAQPSGEALRAGRPVSSEEQHREPDGSTSGPGGVSSGSCAWCNGFALCGSLGSCESCAPPSPPWVASRG